MDELAELTKRIQTVLGFTGTDLDGRFGVKTAHAVLAKLDPGAAATVSAAPGPVSSYIIDTRSSRNIASLSPWVRPIAITFLARLHAAGIDAKVTSGTRSYGEQDQLYASGRTNPGPIVTNARGGYSNHNFGIAFDITAFDEGGRELGDEATYAKAGAIGKQLGLSWGGDWNGFVDNQHYELRPKWAAQLTEHDMITELRRRAQANESIA